MLDSSPRFKMIELDETTSTNTFLATYRPPTTTYVTLVTAEYQSGGRGQAGNSWESERGQNLLFSLLLHPSFLPATHLFALSELIALSIRDAVLHTLAAPHPLITVKWPNDIYAGDCKLGGILIENELSGHAVSRSIIGCGLNVNQTTFRFPSSIPNPTSSIIHHPSSIIHPTSSIPTPVSLHQLAGHPFERQLILSDIIDAFFRRYDALASSLLTTPQACSPLPTLHADYLAALYRRDGFHPYHDANGSFLAEIADVEPTGHLLLRDESGSLRRYAFKEVAYLR